MKDDGGSRGNGSPYESFETIKMRERSGEEIIVEEGGVVKRRDKETIEI